jgi:Holliday junction resolvase RusA-like endonuclease
MVDFSITIPWTPKAKASVRLGVRGAYNPSKVGMLRLRNYVVKNMYLKRPLTGPLFVLTHFVFPAPASKKPVHRKAYHQMPHAQKPDADNLEKFLNDALNGIVWNDDCQIVWLVRSKTKSQAKEGHTYLYVAELANAPPDYDRIMTMIAQNINLTNGEPREQI